MCFKLCFKPQRKSISDKPWHQFFCNTKLFNWQANLLACIAASNCRQAAHLQIRSTAVQLHCPAAGCDCRSGNPPSAIPHTHSDSYIHLLRTHHWYQDIEGDIKARVVVCLGCAHSAVVLPACSSQFSSIRVRWSILRRMLDCLRLEALSGSSDTCRDISEVPGTFCYSPADHWVVDHVTSVHSHSTATQWKCRTFSYSPFKM